VHQERLNNFALLANFRNARESLSLYHGGGAADKNPSTAAALKRTGEADRP